MIKFIITDVQFSDWIAILKKTNRCILIDKNDIENYITSEYRLLPLGVKDYIEYNHLHNSLFHNNIESIHILNNKSKFGKYMQTNFIDYIPKIYYYNFDNENYINTDLSGSNKFIIKPNENCGGVGIRIIYKIDIKKNHIIQKYIDHSKQYVGHFLILNGAIQCKIYFCSDHKQDDIKHGSIKNYKIIESLEIDDSIFNKIFYNLTFSGFACANFIIINNKIIIFEVKPRIGGSLVHNEKYFNLFLDKLVECITNKIYIQLYDK